LEASGGRKCQGRDDDEVAGTFLAQSGDCLKQFDLPGLFDDNHFIAFVAPIVHALLEPFSRLFNTGYIIHATFIKRQDD
jgi:hypothetical protein